MLDIQYAVSYRLRDNSFESRRLNKNVRHDKLIFIIYTEQTYK